MILRIPSKMIQYGYVEVSVDVPDSPEKAAQIYMDWVSRFQVAEQNVVENVASGQATPEGLQEAAENIVKETLGATKVADEAAPWDEPAPAAAEAAWDKPVEFDLFS